MTVGVYLRMLADLESELASVVIEVYELPAYCQDVHMLVKSRVFEAMAIYPPSKVLPLEAAIAIFVRAIFVGERILSALNPEVVIVYAFEAAELITD